LLVGGFKHLDYFPFQKWDVILPIGSYFSRWLLHHQPVWFIQFIPQPLCGYSLGPWGQDVGCSSMGDAIAARFAGITDASEGLGAVLGGAIAVAMTNGSG